MTAPDPFDEGVPRGRYGRPLIIPAGRSGKPNLKAPLVEYDRASTVADALDTGGALARWQTRHAALGVATNPDLAALAAALGRNLNTFSDEDKRNLDAIIERAHDRSGGNEKADYGTAVHSLTEPGNDGTVVIESMAGDVASYHATIDEAGIEVDATETFVVNDTIKVAGTFDHTYRLTRDLTVKVNGVEVTLPAGTKLIGDKKTGSLHFDAHAIQLAIYARGAKYDHNTGERTPLDVSPQWGVVAHVAREGAKTTLYLVDIADGWKGAKLAVDVRAYTLGARKRLTAPIASATAPTVEPDVVEPDVVEPDVVDTGMGKAIAEAEQRRAERDANDAAKIAADKARYDAALAAAREKARAEFVPSTVGEAIGVLNDAGLGPRDLILHQIGQANTRDELAAVWRANKPAWNDGYTKAAELRAAKLNK